MLTPDKPPPPQVLPPDATVTGSAHAPTPLDPSAFAEAHRALLSDGAIQFDLPMQPPPPPPQPPPAWLDWLMRFFGSDHPGLRFILWVLAALFVLAILALIVARLRGSEWPWRRRRGEEEADESWRPEGSKARTLLGEADALAAAGRYGEAAHLLLYRSIEDVDERRPELIRKSLTARDIAGLPAIPDRPRGAFLSIALLVERAIFARRELAEPDWRTCRAAYEQFAFAEGWR